jgi:Zn-dependent M28 family amino/carboxypeptidase
MDTDWIGETYTSTVGWDHLRALVDVGNRMAGSAGEREAAELTRAALADAGARDATLDPFDLVGWTRGESHLIADDERYEADHACFALPRSPSGVITAELVDLGHGLPADFAAANLAGKVVLIRSDVPDWTDRFIHRREKYCRAIEGGAAAFLFANHVPGCLPPTGTVAGIAGPVGEIPALGLSKEAGARVARRAAGEPVTVHVEADVDRQATSQNVHARFGPDTDERVLVTSHVDAHDIAEGAMDNGAGTAMVVEVAAALDRWAPDLEVGIEFVCFGSEEVGLVGARTYADAAASEELRAVCNLDGIGQTRTVSLRTHGFEAFETHAETVADRLEVPVEITPIQYPHSDHWPFVERGVPGVMAYSDTGNEGRGWGHTHADTLDKLDARDLREGAIAVAALVAELANEGGAISHVEPSTIGERLEAEGRAESLRVTSDWPFED